MLIEDFKASYILNDGQVLSLACDFSIRQIQICLNIRKKLGKKTEPYELDLLFKEVTELDLLENFDVCNYSDLVFVKLDTGSYYFSIDPFDNSGVPSDNDNFVIKSHEVLFLIGDEPIKIV